MADVTTVKEAGGLSLKTPEGAVINITINQRSALDCLLDAIRFTRTERKARPEAKPPREERPPREACSAFLLGIGISLLSLGCFTIMLTIITTYYGTLVWVGVPYCVFGVMNIVAYRFPKNLWVESIAFSGLWVCLGMPIADTVRVAGDFYYRPFATALCDELYQGNRPSYDETRLSNFDGDWRVAECKRNLQSYEDTMFGLTVICLLLRIWGSCIAAFAIGCRMKVLFVARKYEKLEEEKDDPLISPRLLDPNSIIAIT